MFDYIRELKFYRKLEVYRNIAPVFSYLLVMVFAFLLAEEFSFGESLSYLFYSLAFAFIILAFQYNKKIFSLCFFFIFSLLYYNLNVDKAKAILPEMELSLDIRVDAINTLKDTYTSGFATIIDAYDFNEELYSKEVFFVIYGKEQKIDIGTKLKILASLKPVGEGLSGFDSFLSNRKIFYRLVSNTEKIQPLDIGYFESSLQSIRAYILENIENSSSKYEAYLPMYRALMIGDMSKVDKAVKQKFARSASIHIFAISGLHVGLVASLLLLFFRAFGLRYSLRIVLSLVILYVYVQVCGAKPSAMRAYMMLSFVALAYLFRRKANSFNALLISAMLALLYEPKNLYNIGFLLSYCVVASIVLYGLSLYDYLSKKYKPYSILPDKFLIVHQRLSRRFYAYLLLSFCISYSALLGGGMLSSYFFGYIGWSSVINFVIFIPLVSLILFLGFFSLFMPSVISRIINDFILMLLEFMTSIASYFSDSNFVIDIKIGSVYFLIFALFCLFATLIYLKDKRDLRLIYLPISIFSLVLLLCT